MTFGATAALGTVIQATPTALNVVAADAAIEIETDGGGAPVMPVNVTLVLERT